MSNQLPMEGVYLRKEYGDTITYGVTCECSDNNHDHNVWVEADECGVSVTIYTQQKSKWWEQSRWRTIWTLLTKGYIEVEANIVLTEQQAINYSNILQAASNNTKEYVAARMNSNTTA
jgi:hypothetical protein